MEQERIILKKLREQNKLSLDEAAKLIGRSKGWLSEIENNKGRSVLRPQEYKRIYDFYEGDQYKRYFGSWVRSSSSIPESKQSMASLDGAIYKFLRCHKAKLSIDIAAKRLGVSKGYLSKIENGRKSVNKEFKNKVLKTYGYSPGSWRNFATDDKRGKSIPIGYKLEILFNSLSEKDMIRVFIFIQSISKDS